jgi:hypothetical protein
VRAPRVNDKRVDPVTGQRQRLSSAILPAWARKSPKVAEVLPLLYLHGLSSGDFGPALEQFLGSGAGLSAATITRLTKDWQDEAVAFNKRSLAETDYVYVWGDGIHLKVRLEQDKVCLLVMIGVRAEGTKELVATPKSPRESSRPRTAPSGSRRPRRSPTTSTCSWRSTTARPSTGSTYGRPTRSSRPSPPSGSVSGSPRAPARGPPGWPWRSSSSSQHKLGSAQSTRRTWSRWSAPARSSRRASWSNETSNSPTTMTRNQEVTLTPRDTPLQRS